MASADFCAHESGYPGRPAFQASLTHGYASQISPNKNVSFHCTSSPSTLESVGNGFARPRAAHLRISLGLYGVSVRSLAALVPASFPRLVTLPQLPSPSTSLGRFTFGILSSEQFPFSYRGLAPHKFTPMSGVPCTGAGGRAGPKWKVVTAGPVMRGDYQNFCVVGESHVAHDRRPLSLPTNTWVAWGWFLVVGWGCHVVNGKGVASKHRGHA